MLCYGCCSTRATITRIEQRVAHKAQIEKAAVNEMLPKM